MGGTVLLPQQCQRHALADVDRYSVITSDLHRLLVAGLPGALRKKLDANRVRLAVDGIVIRAPKPRAR
jgi:hypothetical protein